MLSASYTWSAQQRRTGTTWLEHGFFCGSSRTPHSIPLAHQRLSDVQRIIYSTDLDLSHLAPPDMCDTWQPITLESRLRELLSKLQPEFFNWGLVGKPTEPYTGSLERGGLGVRSNSHIHIFAPSKLSESQLLKAGRMWCSHPFCIRHPERDCLSQQGVHSKASRLSCRDWQRSAASCLDSMACQEDN